MCVRSRGSRHHHRQRRRWTPIRAQSAAGGKADLSASTVCDDLLRKLVVLDAAGVWEIHTKVFELPLKNKKSGVISMVTFTRPYLRRRADDTLILVSSKSHFDFPTIYMQLVLQLIPYRERLGADKYLAVWQDACGLHQNKFIIQFALENKVLLDCFLKGYTSDLMQIGDLLYNGAVKADAVTNRAKEIFEQFNSWQLRTLTRQTNLAWEPQLPTLAESILMTVRFNAAKKADATFRGTVATTFLKWGHQIRALHSSPKIC